MIQVPQKVVPQELQTEKNMKITGKKYLVRKTRRKKMSRKKTAIVSGYFDPLHVGHIEYFKLAKEMADELIVIINNREQALIKKGDEFMDERDRLDIVYNLEMVDEAILSVDEDKSVTETIKMIHRFKPMNKLIFCNGGDRKVEQNNIYEYKVCKELGIDMVDNLGAKIRSSSDMTGLVEYDEPNAFKR
tara:strand:- start:452 stop:1018 length:567 start_codon:yes stop_codon:yes gene_type:complete